MMDEQKEKPEEQTELEFSVPMYKKLLIEAHQEVRQQKLQLEEYKEKEIAIRDHIAMGCFVKQFKDTPSFDVAAEDAYKAADAFLRVRDHGKSYDTEIIEELKDIILSTPNDTSLGTKIRNIYNR